MGLESQAVEQGRVWPKTLPSLARSQVLAYLWEQVLLFSSNDDTTSGTHHLLCATSASNRLTICLNSQPWQITLPFGKMQKNQQLTLINLLLTPDNEEREQSTQSSEPSSGID